MKLLPRDEAAKWFEEVVPQLANLLLRLPSLLETHYENADDGVLKGVKTGLRLLESQEPGIVFLSQVVVVWNFCLSKAPLYFTFLRFYCSNHPV